MSTRPPPAPSVVEAKSTDKKSRVVLPKEFAGATVLIERISDTELRIRKAQVIPEDELRFLENSRAPLTDTDRDVFLGLLAVSPKPNKALRTAVKRHKIANA